jgi:hypothetical protein
VVFLESQMDEKRTKTPKTRLFTPNSTLALTVTGPGNYYYFDFQPVNVTADAVCEYSFTWSIPNVSGTYVVEVGLVPAQLTAYDVAWWGVK